TSRSFEIRTIASEVAGPSGPVRFALGQNGEPRLLLPLRAEEDPRRVRGAPALAVEASTLVQGGQPTRFLDLTCRAAELEEVFARVADQILERIANGSGGVEAAHTTLEQFRSLLLRSPATDIDTARIA